MKILSTLSWVFTVICTLFLLMPAIAQDKTSTGFYYPTGTSNLPPTDGRWLATGCDTYFAGMYHLGYDLMQPKGKPVYAISKGVVTDVLPSDDPDLSFIWIQHDVLDPANGNKFSIQAVYGHTTAQSGIVKGSVVTGGQTIGVTMHYPDGDHCHFGVNLNGIVTKADYFTMSYINSQNQTVQTKALIGWGRGNFGGAMPAGWCSHASQNKATLEKRGYVDPIAFINKYQPAEVPLTDIYVDLNYTGDETGTADHPYKTVMGAVNRTKTISTNVTIHIKPGVYKEKVSIPRQSMRSLRVVTNGSGTVKIRP